MIKTLNLDCEFPYFTLFKKFFVFFLIAQEMVYLTGLGHPVSMQNSVVTLLIHFIFLNKYMI